MKLRIISNIKSSFTYKTVYRNLRIFWIDRIITSNYKKIQLTVFVTTNDNRTFIIFKNLSFSISRIIGLKDISSLLFTYFKQNKDLLIGYQVKDIFIKYKLISPCKESEIYLKKEINIISKYRNILLLLIFVVLGVILIVVSFNLNIYYASIFPIDSLSFTPWFHDVINESTTSNLFTTQLSIKEMEPTISLTSKNRSNSSCIFNTFIELFNNSNSTYKYFPSHFIDGQFHSLVNIPQSLEVSNNLINEMALVKINSYDKYFLLEYNNNKYYYLISDIYDIVSEYIQANK